MNRLTTPSPERLPATVARLTKTVERLRLTITRLGTDLTAERALADDLAGALETAIDLLDTDDDTGVLNALRGPLARWGEARR